VTLARIAGGLKRGEPVALHRQPDARRADHAAATIARHLTLFALVLRKPPSTAPTCTCDRCGPTGSGVHIDIEEADQDTEPSENSAIRQAWPLTRYRNSRSYAVKLCWTKAKRSASRCWSAMPCPSYSAWGLARRDHDDL